jgi:hypothetical protein
MMKIRGFIEGFYNRKPKKNDYSFKNSNITHYQAKMANKR